MAILWSEPRRGAMLDELGELDAGRTPADGKRMPRCEVRIDRRHDIAAEVRAEIGSLVESVQGLEVSWIPEHDFETASDAAKYRDFAALARLRHDDRRVLEWATEELVEVFGWTVDVAMVEVT